MESDKLDEIMEKASQNLTEKTEMGEVTKEFSESKPSSSNLTQDEFTLVWRAKNILKRLSPKSVSIIDEFIDMKRSVRGWNTEQKVKAITGIQEQRSGTGLMNKFFQPKQ